MRSHYVSQFIIKNFAKAINVFDMKKGEIDEHRRPNKVFFEFDKYPEDIEKGMQRYESRVSKVLYTKLSSSGKVILTRRELADLRIYLLICSVRTLSPKAFVSILKGTESIKSTAHFLKKEYPNLKSIEELGLSDEEVYLRALKIFTTVRNVQDIPKNNLCTLEIYYWSMPFLLSYMSIWDTKPNNEFILSDNGMMSEYEGFFRITGGVSASKESYCYQKLLSAETDYEKTFYANLFVQTRYMFENFNFFNIGPNRIVVLINPFFWLYYRNDISKPNIWPCIIPYQSLFAPPEKKYMLPFVYTEDDLFIYEPKVLDDIQTIYMNSIILSQSRDIIGFNDPSKIKNSVNYGFWETIHFKSITHPNSTKREIEINLLKNFLTTPLGKLADYCTKKGRKTNNVKLDQFFDMMLNWIWRDFETNEYICCYLLSKRENIINNKLLDVFGKGEKKIEYLQKHLNEILKHKN